MQRWKTVSRLILKWGALGIGLCLGWGVRVAEASSLVKEKAHLFSLCAGLTESGGNAQALQGWIEYHRRVGVDHFYLYQMGNISDCREMLDGYVAEGIVTLVPWIHAPESAGLIHGLISAYENARLYKACEETTWMMCLNTNELIVPETTHGLYRLLQDHSGASVIHVGTDCFDGSGGYAGSFVRMVEGCVDLIEGPKTVSTAKVIFKPDCCHRFSPVPYECYSDDGDPVSISKNVLRVNHYVNLGKLSFHKRPDRLFLNRALLSEQQERTLLEQGYAIPVHNGPVMQYLSLLE